MVHSRETEKKEKGKEREHFPPIPHELLTNRPRKEDDVFKCKAQSSDSIADHHINAIELLRWEGQTLERESALEGKVHINGSN